MIGDFPFNTDLNATACGTCFYNITGEASNSSEGSLQGTSLKRVVLQANGAIIIKIVPIVSNRADGNGDWTLCACSLYAGSTYANYGLWVIPNPLTIRDPLGDNSETVFWNNSWTFDTTKGFVPELNGPVDGKQVKYINFEALSLLNKYFIFTQQYETIRLSINEIADIQGKYALAMASSVGEISTSLINVEQSVSGKQDKITSTNKLSSDLISGLGAAAVKAVDTAISANSTSTNLPTSKAVEDRINAHSGIDKVGTVTGVKMNGTTKTPSSGVVDLGTVLTDASKFATSAQGTKADNAVPNTRKVNNKALSSDITLGAADVGVTETAFPGLKKTGTVTGVKMNGTTKNPSSGVVDLGTVITAHQSLDGKQDKITSSNKLAASLVSGLAKVATSGSYNDLSNKPTNYVTTDTAQDITGIKSFYNQTKFSNGIQIGDSNRIYGASDSPNVDQFLPAKDGTFAMTSDIPDVSGKLDKTTYEVNKTIDFGSSGVLYVGKFKVYDTNVTCEVTSTTNVTYSGKLVIATQNYVIAQMTVYGDAANTVAPNFFVKPSTTSNPYIEVYFKPSSWSKNVVHIYGSNIQAEPTDVCTNVPSVPSTATLKPKNALPTYSLSGTTLTITLP